MQQVHGQLSAHRYGLEAHFYFSVCLRPSQLSQLFVSFATTIASPISQTEKRYQANEFYSHHL